MVDMVDSGYHNFKAWQKQTVSPNGEIWYNRWLGEFNPEMTADEAIQKQELWKITQKGQDEFKRGWNKAKEEYATLGATAT